MKNFKLTFSSDEKAAAMLAKYCEDLQELIDFLRNNCNVDTAHLNIGVSIPYVASEEDYNSWLNHLHQLRDINSTSDVFPKVEKYYSLDVWNAFQKEGIEFEACEAPHFNDFEDVRNAPKFSELKKFTVSIEDIVGVHGEYGFRKSLAETVESTIKTLIESADLYADLYDAYFNSTLRQFDWSEEELEAYKKHVALEIAEHTYTGNVITVYRNPMTY